MSRAKEHAVLLTVAYRDPVARPENLGTCTLCGARALHAPDCPWRRAREILGGFDNATHVQGEPVGPVTPASGHPVVTAAPYDQQEPVEEP